MNRTSTFREFLVHLFFHVWGSWSPIQKDALDELFQERHCLICNKAQVRRF